MLIRAIFFTFFAFLTCSLPALAEHHKEDQEALTALLRSDIVAKYHKSAYGYAIFPTIGKGGLGVGAAHGKGGVYKMGVKVGNASMTQVSIGFQAGAQAYSQVIYFQDKRAFDEFTSGAFEFSAQAEAIVITSSAGVQAGSEGASASANSAQAEAKYHKGMIAFTMGKGGLMYQATLGGQKYNYTPLK